MMVIGDDGDDLHLLLDVPQLLFKLLSLGLVGRFDVFKMGNSYLKKTSNWREREIRVKTLILLNKHSQP